MPIEPVLYQAPQVSLELSTLPNEVIWNICIWYLDMEDIFNLRVTNSKFKIVTSKIKKIWKIKKEQLEDKLIKNRVKSLQAWTMAKPRIGRHGKLILDASATLFQALNENLQLTKSLHWMDGKFDQQKVEKFGLEEQVLTNLIRIHGLGCWAFANKEKSEEGLLIRPRCRGDGYYCDIEQKWVKVVIVEIYPFLWKDGVADSLCCMEEEEFKSARYFPLFGQQQSLIEAMDNINVQAFHWTSHGEINQYWYFDFQRIWLPKISCYYKRDHEKNHVDGLGGGS